MKVVDPNTLAVPWAYRGDRIVHLKGFNGNSEGLVCGGCRKPVIYRRGVDGMRTPHFAHKADGTGSCAAMTRAHRIFRDATAQMILAAGGLPAAMISRMPWLEKPFHIPGTAQVEALIPGTDLRADVLFTPTAWPKLSLALEVEVSHRRTAAEERAIHATGASIAVLRVRRDHDRFASCATDADLFQVAADEIRREKFRLVSHQKRAAIFVTRIIDQPAVVEFACKPGALQRDAAEMERRRQSWARMNAAIGAQHGPAGGAQ